MKNIVTNIQRFCLQDGPGIRTTVFFKGCNLNCPWCSNPENISFDIEKSIDGKIVYGKELNCDELYEEIIRDKIYYDNVGGVTFSGGEPLWHMFDVEPLLKRLKEKKVSIAIETSLSTPLKYLERSLLYADYYLVDIKILSAKAAKKINIDVDLFTSNIDFLLRNNTNIKFRIPLVKEYTYEDENIQLIYDLLVKNNVKEIDVFNVHELGKSKYTSLGKTINHFDVLSDNEINILKKKFAGIRVNVLKI
jgi:pyruvate formate lyase activating enzyme